MNYYDPIQSNQYSKYQLNTLISDHLWPIKTLYKYRLCLPEIIKTDLKTIKLEAITRSAYNLSDYSHARRDVSGKKRVVHVSVKGSQDKTIY